MEAVEAALRQGARKHGFATELWTLPRIAAVIEQVTGEKFHPGHVWKLLGRWNWSVRKPAEQAQERNAEKVQYWIEQRWPEVKKRLAAESLDLLPRRIRIHPAALGPHDVGAAWRDIGSAVAWQSLG